jgi:cytochrome P450
LQAFSIINRVVTQDTTVSDANGTQYLLKSGAVLQIPTSVLQTSPEVWGPSAGSFDPRRFLKTGNGSGTIVIDGEEKAKGKEEEKMQKKAYFPFSGGQHKCPGRHFATAEHLAMVAMLVLGFEITTLDGKEIAVPRNREGQRGISSGVGKPNDEFMRLQVKVERRRGWEDVTWRFKVADEK